MIRSRGPLAATCAVLALAAGASAASADDRDHTRPAPFDRWSRGLFFAGEGVSVAGIDGAGFGVVGEVARGHGRWQLFGDAALMHTSLQVAAAPVATAAMTTSPSPTPDAGGVDGFETRLGLGARRLVRAFEPDHSASIEMYLQGGLGLSRVWWNGGGTLTRPDVSLGAGWQIRGFHTPLLSIRFAAAIVVRAPVDDQAMGFCTGTCPPAGHHGADPGFISQVGVAW